MTSSLVSEPSFTAFTQEHVFNGLLLDFDGTIIDSTDAIIKHWHKMGKELGADPDEILATSHGRRTIDVLRLYDEKKATREYALLVEGSIPKEFGPNVKEIPGARELLYTLDQWQVPWAVVTSGTSALIQGWVDVMKIARPEHMVVAEDVENGKPDPACYLLGCQRLGLGDDAEVLVVEDAPAGIRAGKMAGFKVLALATTHPINQLRKAGADWIVKDLRSLAVLRQTKGNVHVEIREALLDGTG